MKAMFSIQVYESPRQLELVLQQLAAAHPNWRDSFDQVQIVDCSTTERHRHSYQQMCNEQSFNYLGDGRNYGVSGGRKLAAQGFLKSGLDLMVTQGDGLLWQPETAPPDRFGFLRWRPNFFRGVLNIVTAEGYDYFKLTFCEKYGVNSDFYTFHWLREDEKVRFFPGCFKGTPSSKIFSLSSTGEIPFATGEFSYSNWPAIWNRRLAKELILGDPNKFPSEGSWMRQWFRMQLDGGATRWRGGVVLMSPVEYSHKFDYDRKSRIEAG